MNSIKENIIDVTVLKPQMKHPTIFRKFDELGDGEELTIYNDHDPKPLYYQLLSERGETFRWTYLEEGPDRWVVNILKINPAADKTVGQIAADDWRKAQVFKKFGIDFCCGGKKSLKQVCDEKNLDFQSIEKELQNVAGSATQRALPFNEWTAEFLIDYIVNFHHAFVRKTLPDIRKYAYKVAAVHGEFHPELRDIYRNVEAINEELMQHMVKEEEILFPYIKELTSPQGGKDSCFSSVAQPISVMEHEHDAAGRLMDQIRNLSLGYKIPPDACASFTLLYKMLEEFESDLHTHIHLENNILFPKAVSAEKEKLRN